MYHPAAALHQQGLRQEIEADMQNCAFHTEVEATALRSLSNLTS